ncbi:MAG: hypothetical protein LBF68_00360 [Christensenellaceae bacterium]|jgi:hypothetical protein|nr:hypothetical protein [Christensenellaceae bacterium]
MKKKNHVFILIFAIFLILLITACTDDQNTLPSTDEIRIPTVAFDVSISPTYGLDYVYIPLFHGGNFPKEVTGVEGEHLEDLAIETKLMAIGLSWGVAKYPNLYVALLALNIKPTAKFSKSIELRSITGLVFEDEKGREVLPFSVKIHTIKNENAPGVLTATRDRISCYFDMDDGSDEFTLSLPFIMYGIYGGSHSGIILKGVRFGYGNINFLDGIKILEHDSAGVDVIHTFSNPSSFEISFADPATSFSLQAKVRSLRDVELLADTLIIDFSLIDNPSQTFSVYCGSVVFLNC